MATRRYLMLLNPDAKVRGDALCVLTRYLVKAFRSMGVTAWGLDKVR